MAEQAQLDPVAMIQAQLNLEKQAPEPKQEPKQEAQEEVVEAPEAEPEEEAPEPNKQVEGDDIEIPLDRLEALEMEVTVKGDDGKDVVEKPTVKELRDGYMRQKDYSRKTAELARQREEVSEKTRQGIAAERAQALEALQAMEQTLIDAVAPELRNVDWNDLAANDPALWAQKRQRADQISQALQGIKTKQQELKAKADADVSQARTKAAREAISVLEADIPGWNDTLYQTLLKTGVAAGFDQKEVSQWVDPRAIKLLHKAYLYDKLQADKPVAGKKVVVPPKVIKPGSTATPSRQREVEAFKRLQDSGNIMDAAAVIRSRM